MLYHGLAAHKTERNGAGAWPIRHGQDSSNQPISRPCQPMPFARSSRPAKKPVVQRLMLETQVRGLAAVFGLGLPRGLSPAFVQEVLDMSKGVADLPAAMRALIVARGRYSQKLQTSTLTSSISCASRKPADGSRAFPAWSSLPHAHSLLPLTIQHGSDGRATSVAIAAWARAAISPVASILPGTYQRPWSACRELRSTRRRIFCSPDTKGAEAEGLGADDRTQVEHAQSADRPGAQAVSHHARNAGERHRLPPGLKLPGNF